MRVLLADDHAVVREGLKRILAGAFPHIQFGEAGTASAALALWANSSWDLVMLDVSMPGRNGLEVLRQIRQQDPKQPVLVISMHPVNQYGVRCLQAGAAGYLTKDVAPKELIRAVRKALSGGKYVSASLAEKLVNHLGRPSERPPHELLSDREYQVLQLIATGNNVSRIAGQLSLSVKTISTYRSRLLRKLGLENNAELMHYASRNRLAG